MSNALEEIKGIYSKFIVSDDGQTGELPLDDKGQWTLKAVKSENPDNWKVHDAVTDEFFNMPSRGIPAALRMAAGEFICTYKDIAPKVGNVEEPVKHVEESYPIESFEEPEQPKKAEWVVGGKPTVVKRIDPDNLEAANLPAPVGVGIVRPAVTAQEALAAWREFQKLKKYIIERSDIQVIQGKNYVKKSGWRKFATFYNLTDTIIEEKRETLENGTFLWKMKVICTAPNGRQTEGVAICTSTEKKFAHPEHDVYTTCHTRAKNRAISDMIAAGEVSAEEMEA